MRRTYQSARTTLRRIGDALGQHPTFVDLDITETGDVVFRYAVPNSNFVLSISSLTMEFLMSSACVVAMVSKGLPSSRVAILAAHLIRNEARYRRIGVPPDRETLRIVARFFGTSDRALASALRLLEWGDASLVNAVVAGELTLADGILIAGLPGPEKCELIAESIEACRARAAELRDARRAARAAKNAAPGHWSPFRRQLQRIESTLPEPRKRADTRERNEHRSSPRRRRPVPQDRAQTVQG